MATRIAVYAVIRHDAASTDPNLAFTVKEVLPTKTEADAEVVRLRELNSDKGCRYFVQTTRFFPHGRGSSAMREGEN